MLVVPGLTGFGLATLLVGGATWLFARTYLRGAPPPRFASQFRLSQDLAPGLTVLLLALGAVLVGAGLLLGQLPAVR